MAAALDTVLERYARVRFPFDQPWMPKAVEYCAGHLEQIRVFCALGLNAILDPGRQALIHAWLHDRPRDIAPDEYGFNVWLLNECIGEGDASPEDQIFFRCMGCYRIRTNRSVSKGMCRCRGRRLNNCVGEMETQEILALLVTGG